MSSILSADELLLQIYLFILKLEVAKRIAAACLEKAKEEVVRDGAILRPALPTDPPEAVRARSPAFVLNPMTTGEVYRLHAVWLWMGFYPRTRVEDYWSEVVPDLRVKAVADAFEKSRYKPEAFIHRLTLFPRHPGTPKCPKV